MEKFLNRNIKELIAEYPSIKKVLDEYNIGCSTCGLGSCPLKDIVEVHNLSVEQELDLMTKIGQILFPGQTVEIPVLPRKPKRTSRGFSPPVAKLVEEHVSIKKVLSAIPALVHALSLNNEEHRLILTQCIDFIKNYADGYHHAKEEDILFKFFDEQAEIIQSMYKDHIAGRGHVKAVVEGMAAADPDAVKTHLTAYRELLMEHIKKEDEILYPWMDRSLTDSQVGQMFAQCAAVDARFGDKPGKYEAFAQMLEKTYA